MPGLLAADGSSAVRSACVPGSHHANFALPVSVASCEEEMGLVKQLEFEAGDVLFFAVRHSPRLMIWFRGFVLT